MTKGSARGGGGGLASENVRERVGGSVHGIGIRRFGRWCWGGRCVAADRSGEEVRWGCSARGHGAVATQTRGCSQCLYQRLPKFSGNIRVV